MPSDTPCLDHEVNLRVSEATREYREAANRNAVVIGNLRRELRDAEARADALEAKAAVMQTEVSRHRKDTEEAAGALTVPLPEPGTDVARLLRVIRHQREEIATLARQRDEARDCLKAIESAPRRSVTITKPMAQLWRYEHGAPHELARRFLEGGGA